MKRYLLASSAILFVPALALAQTGPLSDADVIDLRSWNYNDSYAQGWSAEALLGESVYDPTGDDIGDVEDMIVDADGQIVSIIAEVGGFLDIGDVHVNVPIDQITIAEDVDGIGVPITEDTLEDYTLFPDALTRQTAASEVVQADDVETGPRAWRITELVGDYVSLEGDVNYGYVTDVIIGDDYRISAVVVQPDVGYGRAGYYGYPFYGYEYGWDPGADYYDLPYTEDQAAGLDTFEYDQLRTQ